MHEDDTPPPSITFSFLINEEEASKVAIRLLTDEIGNAINDLARDSGIALMSMCEEDHEHDLFVPVPVNVQGLNYCAECAAEELQAIENDSVRFRWDDDILTVDEIRTRIDDAFDEIEASKPAAVCWDGCHKIYVLRDEAEIAHMREMGYCRFVFATPDRGVTELMQSLKAWYEEACPLVFVDGIGPDGKTWIPQVFSRSFVADDEADAKVNNEFAEIIEASFGDGGEQQ